MPHAPQSPLFFPTWPPPTIPVSESLGEVLQGLEAQIWRRRLPVVLRPGLEPEAIRKALVDLGLTPNESLVTWWSWHDGAERSPNEHGHFGQRVFAPPLDEAIARWHAWREYDEWIDGEFFGVPPHYLPILTLDAADSHIVDTRTGEAVEMVWQYSEDEWIRWPDLATFIADLVDGLAQGYEWLPGEPGIHTPDPDLFPHGI
jgi:hypothetical protein